MHAVGMDFGRGVLGREIRVDKLAWLASKQAKREYLYHTKELGSGANLDETIGNPLALEMWGLKYCCVPKIVAQCGPGSPTTRG